MQGPASLVVTVGDLLGGALRTSRGSISNLSCFSIYITVVCNCVFTSVCLYFQFNNHA